MEQQPFQMPVTPPKKKRHFVLIVLILALALFLGGQIIGELMMIPLNLMISDAGIRFLLMYLSFIGIDIAILVYCVLAERDIFRSFLAARQGGGRGNTLGQFALGLLIGFLMNGVCILVAWLHGDLHFGVDVFRPLYLLAALLCVLIQSGAEELVTRGYMLSALRKRYSVWLAVVLNSVFFAALHLLNPGVTVLAIQNILAIGVALSLIVVHLDSLWMAIAIHTAWNFTQNFLFGLPNSGAVSECSFLYLDAASSSVMYDAVFGVEGALPSVIVIALLAVAVVLYAKRKKPAAA